MQDYGCYQHEGNFDYVEVVPEVRTLVNNLEPKLSYLKNGNRHTHILRVPEDIGIDRITGNVYLNEQVLLPLSLLIRHK